MTHALRMRPARVAQVKRGWTLLFLWFLCVGLCMISFGESLKGRISYPEQQYRLGPGDVLALQVLHEADYNQNAILVRPDGYVSIVGVGDIQAADRTLKEVSAEVTQALGEMLNQPKVVLSLNHTRPATIYLAGAVVHPGMYQFNTNANEGNLQIQNNNPETRTDLRLSNVLANAGGVRLNADLGHLQITHQNTGESQTVNLWQVLKGDGVSQDILLHPGDSIFVPTNPQTALNDEDYALLLQSSVGPKTFPVRMVGEVRNPGVYLLDGDSPLLSSALAKAGGYLPQANRNIIAIKRFQGSQLASTMTVNPNQEDIQLRPNDVLFVSENRGYLAGRFLEQAARILSPFQAMSLTGAGMAQAFGWGGWANRNNTGFTSNNNANNTK